MSQPDTTKEIESIIHEYLSDPIDYPYLIQALESYINNKVKEARIDELDNRLPSLLNYSLNQEQLNLIHDRIKELKSNQSKG